MSTNPQDNAEIRQIYARCTARQQPAQFQGGVRAGGAADAAGHGDGLFRLAPATASTVWLMLRLMSSVCAMVVVFTLRLPQLTDWQRRICCAGWYLVPSFFISCMIQSMDGVASTYYAGLNLVILAIRLGHPGHLPGGEHHPRFPSSG